MSEDTPSLSDAQVAANKAALAARRIQKLEIERERESLRVTQKISAQIPISVVDRQIDQKLRLLLAVQEAATRTATKPTKRYTGTIRTGRAHNVGGLLAAPFGAQHGKAPGNTGVPS